MDTYGLCYQPKYNWALVVMVFGKMGFVDIEIWKYDFMQS